MKHYELVLLLNASLQDKDRKDFISQLEAEIKDGLLKKDDMGLITGAHDLGEKKGNNKFYFVSYYLNSDTEGLNAIKQFLLYNKVVFRYFIFGMNTTDEFFAFDKLQEQMTKILDALDEKKAGSKVSFFTKPENKKYITWKALPMLKKYMTRFGDVKPRKYTKNPVNVQKSVRNSILRAREMGLLEYIK